MESDLSGKMNDEIQSYGGRGKKLTSTKEFMEMFGKMTEKDMQVFLAILQVTELPLRARDSALLLAKALVKAHGL